MISHRMGAPRSIACAALLDDRHGAALAQDEAIALAVERPRGVFGVVVALRERTHVAEGSDSHREDRRLGAAGDDDVAVTLLDEPQGVR